MLEKLIKPLETIPARPKQLIFFRGQVLDSPVNRKIIRNTFPEQRLQPFFHGLTPPWGYGTFIYGKVAVWNNQILINAKDLAKTFTSAAGTIRIIKAEEIDTGLLEGDTVKLKSVREVFRFTSLNMNVALSMPFKIGGLN